MTGTAIWIVADDLTGACDTGVKFKEQGFETRVVIDPRVTSSSHAGQDVVVIDTETRELTARKAKQRLQKLLDTIPLRNGDLVYKKIDSTMRGHVGGEVAIMMDHLDRSLCLLTPAFPAMGRRVVGGELMVGGKPLQESEYRPGGGQGPWHLPHLLQAGTNRPVALLKLDAVCRGVGATLDALDDLAGQGNRIVVCDATSDGHLETIARAGIRLKRRVLFSGSGGLAAQLAGILAGEASASRGTVVRKPGTTREGVIVVNGSRRTIARRQIEQLKRRVDVVDLVLAVKSMLEFPGPYRSALKERVAKEKAGEVYLIYPSSATMPGAKEGGSLREVKDRVGDFLAGMAAHLIRTISPRTLILSGGDTALRVCRSVGIRSLDLRKEIVSGICASGPGPGLYPGLKVITKAGGFGAEDILCSILEKLRELDNF